MIFCIYRNALNGTFTVFFFIGDVPSSPAEYAAAKSLAGTAHFFIAPSEVCENCYTLGQAGAKVSNSTTITPILCDYKEQKELKSLEKDDVTPFLVKNLKWRVMKAPEVSVPPVEGAQAAAAGGGQRQPVPTNSIPGFEIHVNMSLLYTTESSYIPVFVRNTSLDRQVVAQIDNGS